MGFTDSGPRTVEYVFCSGVQQSNVFLVRLRIRRAGVFLLHKPRPQPIRTLIPTTFTKMPLFFSKFAPLVPRLRRLSTATATAGGEDPKLSRIAEDLLALSSTELDDYAALLRHKLRLSLTSSAAAGASLAGAGDAASGASGEEEAAAVKTAFDVKIEKYEAAAKIKIIKEVRAVTDLGLKEAKELVEKAPVVVRAGLPKEEAEALAAKLKAAGAAVALE
jgi:large subunit ribosomal protein L7/L12